MTITAVGTQAGGSTVDNASAWTRAFGSNVAAGNLVVVAVSKYDPGVSFTAGNCTKSAGTATIGTVTLDEVRQAGNIAAGVWSALVTGSGSLTMQVASTAGTYFSAGSGEFASDVGWDAGRVEDHDTGAGTATQQVTGDMTSAGGGLFFGVTSLDAGGLDLGYTQQAAFTRIYLENDAGSHEPGAIMRRIVSSGTTDAVESSTDSSYPWVAAGVVYKEAAGIGFDAAGNSGDQAATNTYSGGASWSGTNRFLAIDVSMLGAGVTVSSMTYGGAACTFVGAISTVTSFGRVEQWRIASSDSGAPATGSNTLVVNLSGSIEFAVEWASYTGVHQSSPTEAFNSAQATNAGSATDASVAVTTVADNCWVHAAVVANDTSISAGNTSRNNISGTLGSGANEDNGSAKTPAGGVTMSYSGMGLTTTWAIAGYAIRPVAAANLSSVVPVLMSQYRKRRT